MSYENKGTTGVSAYVTLAPDRSGNFVCTGTADDVEINAAIQWVIGLGGGDVKLSEGNFDITASILIDADDIKFWGSGWGTKLTLADGVDDHVIDVTPPAVGSIRGTVLQDFWINGNFTNNVTSNGINFINRQGKIRNVMIDHPAQDGIYVADLGGGGTQAFENGFTGNIVQLAARDCYSIADSAADNSFVNCKAHGDNTEVVGRHGFNAGGAQTYFSNCHAYFNPGEGFNVTAVGNIIQGGEIENNHGHGVSVNNAGAAMINSVKFYGAQQHHIFINSSGCIVSGNTFTTGDDDFSNIYLSFCADALIYGNKLGSTGEESIFVDGGSGHKIYENDIYAASAKTNNTYASVRLHNTADCVVKDNWMESVNHSYGIEETGTASGHIIQGNRIITAQTSPALIVGATTVLDRLDLSFVEGTSFASTPPLGWDIDATAWYAVAMGVLPPEVQEVIRWRIFATSRVTEADKMRLEIEGYGAPSDAIYSTETVSVVNHPSETTNITANDVVYWEIDSSDDTDLDAMLANYQIMIKVIYEIAGGDDAATDAVFTGMYIEYV